MKLSTNIEQLHKRVCNIKNLSEVSRFNSKVNYSWISLFKSNGMTRNYGMQQLIELERTLDAMDEASEQAEKVRSRLSQTPEARHHIPASF